MRVSIELDEKLNFLWKNRLYPSIDDNKKQVPFKSKNEYVEFILRATNNMSPKVWYIFSNIWNPDYDR